MNEVKTVQIDWMATSEEVFQSITLTNTQAHAFEQLSHSNDPPIETVGLNFTDIQCTFYSMPGAGTKTSKPFVQSFNLSKG
jgi:type VI protein secretion system component Hcp